MIKTLNELNTHLTASALSTIARWRYLVRLLALVVVALLSGGSSFAATAGDLDVSFGTAGRATTPFAHFGPATAVVVQPDGKVVVVGGSFDVVRYTIDGQPDLTFGVNGKASYSQGNWPNTARAVALQADGKIVVAGESSTFNPEKGLVVVRLNANGLLDTTFGDDGVSSLLIGEGTEGLARGIKVQTDGKIVIVGTTPTSNLDFFVVRFTLSGLLDTDFGPGGMVTTNFSAYDRANALLIQPDGKILAGGSTRMSPSDYGFMMVRYLSDGSLDNTFGSGGIAVSNIGTANDELTAMALQPDGRSSLRAVSIATAMISRSFVTPRRVSSTSVTLVPVANCWLILVETTTQPMALRWIRMAIS